MADKKRKRPTINEIRVIAELESGEEERSGADLNSIFRAILWDMEGTGTPARAARRLGFTQQNYDRIIKGKGTTLKALSIVCAALLEKPTEFFQRHERYRAQADADQEAEFATDQTYKRFRNLLSPETAERVANLLDALTGTEKFEAFLRFGEAMIGLEPPPLAGASDGGRRRGEVRNLASARKKSPARRARDL